MKNKEGSNKEGQSQSSVKTFLKNNLSDYFLSNPKYHKSINYCRICNTYLWILEAINILLQFIVFDYTKSTSISIFFSIISGLSMLINSIPRLSVRYNYFKYTLILNGIVMLINILFGIIYSLYFALNRVYVVCDTIQDHKNFYLNTDLSSNQQSIDICENLIWYYQMWFAEVGIFIALRMVGKILCFKAYKYTREKWQAEETKKRRKLRYIAMVKKKEEKKKSDMFFKALTQRKL